MTDGQLTEIRVVDGRTEFGVRGTLNGLCISIEDLRAHYPGIKISDIPRGRSLEEELIYRVQEASVLYSFGFAEKAPGCLNSFRVRWTNITT